MCSSHAPDGDRVPGPVGSPARPALDPDSRAALRATLDDSHPVAVLMDEHAALLLELERLRELGRRLAGTERALQHAAVADLAPLVARLLAAEPHHRREEEVLFPALRARGIHGPPLAMAFQHVRLRALKHALDDQVRRASPPSASALSEIRATVEGLTALLAQHIAEEDGVLFPLALRTLDSADEWREIAQRAESIGPCAELLERAPGHGIR